MEECDLRLKGLMSAFYHAESIESFLEQAEDICGVFIDIEFIGIKIPGLPEKRPKQNGLFEGVVDVVENGVYICAAAVRGNDLNNVNRSLGEIAALIRKGIALYGWFSEIFSAHINTFLIDCVKGDDPFLCLYVPAVMSKRSSAKACHELNRCFDAVHCYREREGFSLLLQCAFEKQEKFFSEISTALARCGLVGGLSGPFANASLAQGCMEKAKESALLQMPDDAAPLRLASSLRWRMFCEKAAQSVGREGFRMEDFFQYALKRILLYDKENNTRYYDSMYQYLIYGKNLKLAAQALSIHRNTLGYRIGRIEELFDIDFEDRHICFEMLFSCKLYEETGAGI